MGANAKWFSLLFKSGSSCTTVDCDRRGETRPAGGEQSWQAGWHFLMQKIYWNLMLFFRARKMPPQEEDG